MIITSKAFEECLSHSQNFLLNVTVFNEFCPLAYCLTLLRWQAKKDKRKLNTTVICRHESNILKLIIFHIQKICITLIQYKTRIILD